MFPGFSKRAPGPIERPISSGPFCPNFSFLLSEVSSVEREYVNRSTIRFRCKGLAYLEDVILTFVFSICSLFFLSRSM